MKVHPRYFLLVATIGPYLLYGMHTQYNYLPKIIPHICNTPYDEYTKFELTSLAQSCYASINKNRIEKHHASKLPEDEACLIDKFPRWNIGHETCVYNSRIFIMPSTKLDRLNIPHTLCYLISVRDQIIKEHNGFVPCLRFKSKDRYGDICRDVKDTMSKETELRSCRVTDAHNVARIHNPYPQYTEALLNDIAKTGHKDTFVMARSHEANCGITFSSLATIYSGIRSPQNEQNTYIQELKTLLPKTHAHFRKQKPVGLLIDTALPTSAAFPNEEHSPCYADKNQTQLIPSYASGIRSPQGKHIKYTQEVKTHAHFRKKKPVGLLIDTATPISAAFSNKEHSPCYADKHQTHLISSQAERPLTK